MLASGTRLGHYQVIDRIGSGGMGEVYRARDARLERDVAVKVLSGELAASAEALGRFEREAKAVAALSHPNILAIHDLGIQDGMPFSVTELLEGESLGGRLVRGPMPWREAAEIGVAVAEGLAAAHAKGIVHRDIKPDNLFITSEGRVKILDFGLARSTGAVAAATSAGSAPTMMGSGAGLVLGTIGYMSPEQARGLEVGVQSDIFSLGCVLYEMVAGRRAFERGTPTDTLAAILNEAPQPVSKSGVQVPSELARVVEHCLEKAPSARFQSATDLAFALRAVLSDSGVGVAPSARRRSARSSIRSLAVLPFSSHGDDPENDYLSEGIAEGLINRLAQIPRLRVVPRATAFRFKARDFDPRTAAAELNVDALLSGRIVSRGNVLTVQAELVDTATASQLWGHRYTRENCHCLEIEDTLADEITAALAPRLGARKPARLAKKAEAQQPSAQVDADAYRDYLRGRYFYNKWTPEGFGKAIEFFQKAIDKDPAFASAYAGLGDAYGAAAYYGYVPPHEAMPRANFAASRAIEIDPGLSEAHATLGLTAMFHRWDWALAERELARAIELDPKLATNHVYHSLFLLSQGQLPEALEAARRAEQLDPLSLLAVTGVAWNLFFSGDLDGAVAQIYRALALDPEFPEALGMLARVAEVRGQFAEAAERLRAWLKAVGLAPGGADVVSEGFRHGGLTGYWRAYLDVLERDEVGCPQFAYARAAIQAKLGNADAVFHALEECLAERLGMMVFIKIDPAFASYRTDPRFQRLLKSMDLA